MGRSHSIGRLSFSGRHAPPTTTTPGSMRLNELHKNSKSMSDDYDRGDTDERASCYLKLDNPPQSSLIPPPLPSINAIAPPPPTVPMTTTTTTTTTTTMVNEVDSYNSGLMTIDDEIGSYSTTFDETTRSYDYPKSFHHSPSMSSSVGGGGGNGGGASASAAAKRRRNKLNKRNRDIKLALLMIFSGAFLVFVLPETLLNIYQYWSTTDEEDHVRRLLNISSSSVLVIDSLQENLGQDATATSKLAEARRLLCHGSRIRRKLSFFLDLFHMLKLLYFSSNFLAYLTLTTFSRVKRGVRKQQQHPGIHLSQQLQQPSSHHHNFHQ